MTTIIICVVVFVIIVFFLLQFARKAAMINKTEENIYKDVDKVEYGIDEIDYEEVDEQPITLGDVYLYFEENGYLKECQEENYKFSTPRLKILIKNEKLHRVDINHPEAATLVTGVGEKVYDLIKHLIAKYKEENAINF